MNTGSNGGLTGNVIPIMNSAQYRRLQKSELEFLFEKGTELSEQGKEFICSLDRLSENYKGHNEKFRGKQIVLVEEIEKRLCKNSITRAKLLVEAGYLDYGEGTLGGLRIHHRGYQCWYALTDKGRAALSNFLGSGSL